MRKLHVFPHLRNKGKRPGGKCAHKLSQFRVLTLKAGTSEGLGKAREQCCGHIMLSFLKQILTRDDLKVVRLKSREPLVSEGLREMYTFSPFPGE